MSGKKVSFIFIMILIGILSLSAFSGAFEQLGSDYVINDPEGDVQLFEYPSSITPTNQYPYLDITQLSIIDSDPNYTITMTFLVNYNTSAKDLQIDITIDVNGSSDLESWQPNFDITQRTDGATSSQIYCNGAGGYYCKEDIHTINGNEVSWTFPKSEIHTNIPNYRTLSEWKIQGSCGIMLSSEKSIGDLLGFGFGFNTGIPGYPLLFLSLIFLVSVIIVIHKRKKPNIG